MKNIAICLDGTGNEFGDRNSNVVKLYRSLEYHAARQLTYYHPGLGTMGAPNALGKLMLWWTRQLGLATGYGFANTLTDAYTFLMNTYEADDMVYIFGFSRGAYLARALASLLHMFGLLRQGEDVLIPYAIRMLKVPKEKTWGIASAFKETFSRECKPCFVGVWDTVSSIGWLSFRKPMRLPYTARNPAIATCRHAISIDEKRCFFRQNLWGTTAAGQDTQQVWFAGVHSDVGGGYRETENALAYVPLNWMIREAAAAGLAFDSTQVSLIAKRAVGALLPGSPSARVHDSLRGLWPILEFLPRRFYDDSQVPPRWRWKIPRAQPRRIPPGSAVHVSVPQFMSLLSYESANLIPGQYHLVP